MQRHLQIILTANMKWMMTTISNIKCHKQNQCNDGSVQNACAPSPKIVFLFMDETNNASQQPSNVVKQVMHVFWTLFTVCASETAVSGAPLFARSKKQNTTRNDTLKTVEKPLKICANSTRALQQRSINSWLSSQLCDACESDQIWSLCTKNQPKRSGVDGNCTTAAQIVFFSFQGFQGKLWSSQLWMNCKWIKNKSRMKNKQTMNDELSINDVWNDESLIDDMWRTRTGNLLPSQEQTNDKSRMNCWWFENKWWMNCW